MAADVAGYSRLMGLDEAGTARTLREHRAVADALVATHGGRIVKTTGDGVLIEFPSVVGAVECAVAVQAVMAERNEAVPQDRRMLFRIGINLGDVLIEGDDILGDGVNIAARLEGIAEPGGICISSSAYDQVRGKVAIEFADMGEQSLKNIARPVRTYAVVRDGLAPKTEAAPATASPRSVPRLSIVVLPFANLGGDPEQGYFVDGVTESLTTDLSRISDSFVIARNTAFTYKDKPVDVKQIGRELGVRYVLEGSVQRGGNRLRVNVQLIDAETGNHLWADRFDREITDLFALQDAITIELAGVLGVELIEAESRRSKRKLNPDAIDLEMQARAAWNRGWSRENLAAANRLYDQALELDPDNVPALTGLATGLAINVVSLWTEAREDDLRRAEALAARAMAFDPHDAYCHYAMGFVRRTQSRFDEAIAELEAAIRFNPNMRLAHNTLGITKALAGRAEEALSHFADAIRLSPRDPLLFVGYFGIGWARFLLRNDDQAVEMLRKSIALNPGYSPAHLFLAAAYAMQGGIGEAREALAAYLRTNPAVNRITLLRANAQSTHPVYMAQRERLYEGMRRAGMPEE
ncbi:MAG TPA: adenylate/guanylate cyclase domain-containing protein [Alphaproteobacteria bacterium]|nr:adenylate/guanylate cyclase domain-containing protein [Alphaproteobacteria bacterium]